jgi:hypothetical protein
VLLLIGGGIWWWVKSRSGGLDSGTPTATTSCPPASQLPRNTTINYAPGDVWTSTGVSFSDISGQSFCIPKGGTVTFTGPNLWIASDFHPIHSDLPGFDAKGAKESYSFIFDTKGRWGFHNHLRASDTGTIVVVE